ncbi:MAG: DUF2911 domain-containing protein [Acidobacteriota bacterium]
MSKRIYPGTAALVLLIALVATPLSAQVRGMPEVSPDAHVTQVVGVAKIKIAYHRPAVNDRDIFGALVPDGGVWRAGANENTTITFSAPAKVQGQSIGAGTYGLHMIPEGNDWTIIFSNNSTSWGSFSYDQAEDALRVTTTASKAPFTERLTFDFENLDNDSATVFLQWAETKIPFEVEFDTHGLALASMQNQLRSRAGFNFLGFTSAANYLVQNDIEHEQALAWADQALGMQRNFATVFTKSRVLRMMGQEAEAEAMMVEAVPLGNEGQVNFLGYQFMQAEDYDQAIEIFQKNVDDHPESWNVYDSLGEAYAAKGDTQRARNLYSKALEMAPDGQKPRIQGILDNMS